MQTIRSNFGSTIIDDWKIRACSFGRFSSGKAPLRPLVQSLVLPASGECASSGRASVHLQRSVFVAVFQHLLQIVVQKRRDGPSVLVLVDMPQLVDPEPATVTRITLVVVNIKA